MAIKHTKTLAVSNTLGEGVTWDARTGVLWWTDIQESRLYCYDYTADKVSHYDTPERVGSFALTDDPDILMCAFASGFSYFTPACGTCEPVVAVEQEYAGTRLNDGRQDTMGRFWSGTLIENNTAAPKCGAGLYCLEKGVLTKHYDGVTISNGLAWNKASDRMYFADSVAQTIWIFTYNKANGGLLNRQVFAKTEGNRYPDGAITDDEDHYWSCQWGSGEVVRYSPHGMIDLNLKVPAPHVTCAAFGGPDMNLLFVTSARDGLTDTELTENPESGHLFIYETPYRGVSMDSYYPAP